MLRYQAAIPESTAQSATWWKWTLTLVVLFHTAALLQAWEHSFRGVANTILFVVFSKPLQHREEGLGLTSDWRAIVQGPWGGQSSSG